MLSVVLLFGRLLLTSAVCMSSGPPARAGVVDPVTVSDFSGSLIQPGAGEGDILRRFEVQLLSAGSSHFFHVVDDVRQGCPWPDSYGMAGPSSGPDRVQPHLVYPYDGNTYFIPLPPLIVALPSDIQVDSTWEQQGWQLRAVETTNVDGTAAWNLEARERRGRQQSLTVDAASGMLMRAESDVFMGMGDQFVLTLARSEVSRLSEETSQAVTDLQSELMTIQNGLKRRPDSQLTELSSRQIADVMAVLPQVTGLAKGTPLEALVRRIQTDAEQQQKRLASASSRATELMNKAVPDFSLSLVSGGELKAESLKGKTVILHFWDYRDSPLTEPYGQTGYLEFLYNRKRDQIQVVGVSTNQDLGTKENQNRGKRSARKLSEFMNLTYPIGYDDGTLLKEFGDPRDHRGQLPLWIVIDPEGKVIHYHAGFYEIDAAQGLKDLEAVLAKP